MIIGLKEPKTDLSIKYIHFEVDGKEHFISFRFSHKKGITGPVIFDSHEAKIKDAYPAFPELVKLSASFIWLDLKKIIRRKFLRNNQGHSP